MASAFSPAAQRAAHPPEISVVICSRNGARKLPLALSSLARQTLDPRSFEVIVVDDGSDDQTSAVAAAHGAGVVRLEPSGGLAAARNAGCRAARGGLIAFTDDDCQVSADWLDVIVATLEDPSIDGISGPVHSASTDGFTLRYLAATEPLRALPEYHMTATGNSDRLRHYLRGVLVSEPPLEGGTKLYSVVGANMAFRRRVLLGLGGFDEAFTFGAEEEELCRRGHRQWPDWSLSYEPAAAVYHHFDPRFIDTLRRARSYGRGHARAKLKHPEMRWIVYPSPVFLAAAIVVGLLAGRPRVMLGGGVLPLATYVRWPVTAWRTRSVEPLVYPYLELAEELWTMRGELEGLRAGYEPTGTQGADS